MVAGQIWRLTWPVAVSALAVALITSESIPLGVMGQWVWNRVAAPPPFAFLFPSLAFLLYLSFVLLGHRVLHTRSEGWTVLLLPLLLALGGAMQALWLEVPSAGLERWPLALHDRASSGYFWHAMRIDDVPTFLANYEQWIADQDSFHVGTHPPGLFLLYRGVQTVFARRTAWADEIVRAAPPRLQKGLALVSPGRPLSIGDQASLLTAGYLVFLVALSTALPLYALARLGMPASSAWLAAALWPTVPAIPLFLPVADCLYPPLAVWTVTLVLWAGRIRLALPAVLAGAVFCAGMFLSLAFLVVLPIAFGALLAYFAGARPMSVGRWVITIIGFGAGVALPVEWLYYQVDLNLPVVWGINLDKHAGFYEHFPRSYRPWIAVNLLEFAIVCGPAAFLLAVGWLARRAAWRTPPVAAAVTLAWFATLLALDLSGRNLGEAARLWIFLTPFSCVAAAAALGEPPANPYRTAMVFLSQWGVGLALVARVEPLLPIALV